MDQEETSRMFKDMGPEELDLTMFTIMDLSLSKIGKHVEMRLELKRKISMEILTTFLPTILLLLITFTSILFDKSLFGDALAVNLTIMLVMTTIFTSKIQELPSTSDTKGSLPMRKTVKKVDNVRFGRPPPPKQVKSGHLLSEKSA